MCVRSLARPSLTAQRVPQAQGGTPGPPGGSGGNVSPLLVVDSLNTTVGVLVDSRQDSSLTVAVRLNNVWQGSVVVSTGFSIGTAVDLNWTSTDCSGTPYRFAGNPPNLLPFLTQVGDVVHSVGALTNNLTVMSAGSIDSAGVLITCSPIDFTGDFFLSVPIPFANLNLLPPFRVEQ